MGTVRSTPRLGGDSALFSWGAARITSLRQPKDIACAKRSLDTGALIRRKNHFLKENQVKNR